MPGVKSNKRKLALRIFYYAMGVDAEGMRRLSAIACFVDVNPVFEHCAGLTVENNILYFEILNQSGSGSRCKSMELVDGSQMRSDLKLRRWRKRNTFLDCDSVGITVGDG